MCQHLSDAARSRTRPVTPSSLGCKECLESGDRWVHLRLCLTCGHVGCCDDSQNRHAMHHFLTTQHPLMTSLEPDENWSWCYIDKMFIKIPP